MALINCVECEKQLSDQAAACPHCGHPNPAFAETKAAPETADEQRARISGASKKDGDEKPAKKNGCLVGCLSLFVGVVILGAIGSMIEDTTPSSSPSQKSTPKVDNSWVPDGFTRYNSKVAIRWSPNGSYSCSYGQRCIQMEVVPRRGCGNLYAELNKIDANGNNVGYTNETTTNVGAGQKAILKFDTYGTFKTFQVSKISCY
ncbi:hypothetical protein [Synechococcus sp. TAK9802]|uniref:hypothetical protein n=1 Tax=Synechococcus sp. TAK9802 TaxID=1442558 RepID=UPI001CA44F86|nr:hypothetical protein [Synechococcus sp. TAK9802]